MSHEHRNDRVSASQQLFTINPYTAAAGLTPEAVERAMRCARRQRADTAAWLARALLRGLRRAGKALLASIARSQRARARRVLDRLDRQLLAEALPSRRELPHLAEATLSAPQPAARACAAIRSEQGPGRKLAA